MNNRDQIVGNQPQDFLHKIAGIVPGYGGYVDRERRRDADRLLRTQLAHQYSAQRDRLNRVQSSLMRSHHMENIAEVDRLVGALQRFIDRLATTTYGYTGLFDPVKVEAQELDQLYAFDMALTNGVDQLSSAIGALETAASGAVVSGQLPEIPAAITRLSTVIDDLNERLNQRADLLTSGRTLPQNEYNSLLDDLSQRPTPPDYTGHSTPPTDSNSLAGEMHQDPIPPAGTAIGSAQSESFGTGEADAKARYGGNMDTGSNADEYGTPTTNLNVTSSTPPGPGLSSLSEGDQGLAGMPADVTMGGTGTDKMPEGGTAGTGVETASSPTAAPGAPGHNLVPGLDIGSSLGIPDQGNAADIPANPSAPGATTNPTNPASNEGVGNV
ncbi:MAG: hypothetical protein IVW55_13725 [Chloroflexi bacterium]|nr:hypothetical protein [Chloroflexota bacterium]